MYLMGEKEDLKKKLADALKENLRKRKEFQRRQKKED